MKFLISLLVIIGNQNSIMVMQTRILNEYSVQQAEKGSFNKEGKLVSKVNDSVCQKSKEWSE